MPKTTVVDKKRKKWNEENMRKAVIAARCKQMGYLKARKTYNVPGATLFRLCKKNMEPEVVCRTKLGLNRNVFTEEDFIQEAQRNEVQVNSEDYVLQEKPQPENTAQNATIVLPQDIIPKQTLRKKEGTRGRKAGQAKVLTSTPKKEELKQSIEISSVKERDKVKGKIGPSDVPKKKFQIKAIQKSKNGKSSWEDSHSSASLHDSSSNDDEEFPVYDPPSKEAEGGKRLAYCERSGLIIALNGLLRTLGHLLEGRAKGRDVAQHHQGSTCQVVYYTELVFGLVADQVSELVFQDSFDMRNHFRLVDKKSGVEIVYQVVCKDL
ncbi:unnamed protein product [Acanthoscelides obtectus]|uniref:HTH psq-type domain-containing protein n=1 Tax=Acanthoscelides obtectus TaxID=200917 RepID=A0A9P0PU44_ACAOB|nr:unnamed protein product [Acanthoscelides obtectus]CAK1627141.1 hypothetical protein AOBTE_LOCUS4337 [Acanthoscelides obtectus]